MIVNLTQESAKQLLELSTKPVVIDVFATWCGPCIQMKPSFEHLATELSDKYVFAELNVDESRDLAIKLNVTSVPTFIFMKNNKMVGREVGYIPQNILESKIKEYLGD